MKLGHAEGFWWADNLCALLLLPSELLKNVTFWIFPLSREVYGVLIVTVFVWPKTTSLDLRVCK